MNLQWKDSQIQIVARGLLLEGEGDTPRVAFSRVGWFSRALAFRSLYSPWGKIGDYS